MERKALPHSQKSPDWPSPLKLLVLTSGPSSAALQGRPLSCVWLFCQKCLFMSLGLSHRLPYACCSCVSDVLWHVLGTGDRGKWGPGLTLGEATTKRVGWKLGWQHLSRQYDDSWALERGMFQSHLGERVLHKKTACFLFSLRKVTGRYATSHQSQTWQESKTLSVIFC